MNIITQILPALLVATAILLVTIRIVQVFGRKRRAHVAQWRAAVSYQQPKVVEMRRRDGERGSVSVRKLAA